MLVLGLLLILVVSIVLILCISFIVSLAVMKATDKNHADEVKPASSLAIAVISAIVGIIMYVNDHSFMNIMRGFDAQLVWFLIAIPAGIIALIQFIRYARKRERKDS